MNPHPLDEEDGPAPEPPAPHQMDQLQLADALELLALGREERGEAELLRAAAERLRWQRGMRDALADRVAEVERLRREVAGLRREGRAA
jgi:hypothetical protein